MSIPPLLLLKKVGHIGLREVKPRLCDNLEGWDGKEGGREVQEGGDTEQASPAPIVTLHPI